MSPHLKKWGGHLPRVPHQIAPMDGSISLEEYLLCDETTVTLIGFLKVGQVSESSECKVKPPRTH